MATKPLSLEEARLTTYLIAALDKFRELHVEFPVQQMLVLLIIAKHGETTLRQVCEALDISQSTASRLIIALGELPARGPVGGYGFITAKLDPEDYRRKLLTLTPKGRSFVEKVLTK